MTGSNKRFQCRRIHPIPRLPSPRQHTKPAAGESQSPFFGHRVKFLISQATSERTTLKNDPGGDRTDRARLLPFDANIAGEPASQGTDGPKTKNRPTAAIARPAMTRVQPMLLMG